VKYVPIADSTAVIGTRRKPSARSRSLNRISSLPPVAQIEPIQATLLRRERASPFQSARDGTATADHTPPQPIRSLRRSLSWFSLRSNHAPLIHRKTRSAHGFAVRFRGSRFARTTHRSSSEPSLTSFASTPFASRRSLLAGHSVPRSLVEASRRSASHRSRLALLGHARQRAPLASLPSHLPANVRRAKRGGSRERPEGASAFSPMFLPEGCPQGAKRLRTPLREKDGP